MSSSTQVSISTNELSEEMLTRQYINFILAKLVYSNIMLFIHVLYKAYLIITIISNYYITNIITNEQ